MNQSHTDSIIVAICKTLSLYSYEHLSVTTTLPCSSKVNERRDVSHNLIGIMEDLSPSHCSYNPEKPILVIRGLFANSQAGMVIPRISTHAICAESDYAEKEMKHLNFQTHVPRFPAQVEQGKFSAFCKFRDYSSLS